MQTESTAAAVGSQGVSYDSRKFVIVERASVDCCRNTTREEKTPYIAHLNLIS